jgi:hypothetical protein
MRTPPARQRGGLFKSSAGQGAKVTRVRMLNLAIVLRRFDQRQLQPELVCAH